MASHRLVLSWDDEIQLLAIERECQVCPQCIHLQQLLSEYLESLSEEPTEHVGTRN